jgi:hypothetical protein
MCSIRSRTDRHSLNRHARAYSASKTRVNALVARGHPRLPNLVAASKTWMAGTSRTSPAMTTQGWEVGRLQDRLTVGCDVLTVAMQVRVLLLDPMQVPRAAVMARRESASELV